MRSLTFHEIDKIYTYLSPDIEYFHGRHLVYGIVALLCIVFIVIGLPLLLTLKPFLIHKIYFTKIKPLLDQFQGCYKVNYRCFAGYYMICRLVIITISNTVLTANYLLIAVCGIIDLIHVLAKPYNKNILNKYDSMVLHLIIFITALQLFDDSDYNSPLVITIAFVLVILPLINYISMCSFLHEDVLKKVIKHYKFKGKLRSCNNVISNEIPIKEFDFTIDDNARKNVTVTVCDM